MVLGMDGNTIAVVSVTLGIKFAADSHSAWVVIHEPPFDAHEPIMATKYDGELRG